MPHQISGKTRPFRALCTECLCQCLQVLSALNTARLRAALSQTRIVSSSLGPQVRPARPDIPRGTHWQTNLRRVCDDTDPRLPRCKTA